MQMELQKVAQLGLGLLSTLSLGGQPLSPVGRVGHRGAVGRGKCESAADRHHTGRYRLLERHQHQRKDDG
jgi:hypothetical protein